MSVMHLGSISLLRSRGTATWRIPSVLCLGVFWYTLTSLGPRTVSAQTSTPTTGTRASKIIRRDITINDVAWQNVPDTLPGQVKALYRGSVATTIVAYTPLEALRFGAPGMSIGRAIDEQGRPLSFTAGQDTIVVHLPRPLASGDTVCITLEFAAEQANVSTVFRILQPGAQPEPTYWLNFPNGWELAPFPVDSSQAPAPWSLTATTPAGYQLMSNHQLTLDSVLPDGRHKTQWRNDNPADRGITAVIARFAIERDTWTGPEGQRIPLAVYATPERAEAGRGALQILKRTMDLYARLLGTAYPQDRFTMLQQGDIEGYGAGEGETFGNLVTVDRIGDRGLYATRERSASGVYQHELAHTWLSAMQIDAPWVNEGAPDFLAAQYWAATGIPRGDQEFLYFWRARYDMGSKTSLAEWGNIYYGGARVFDLLRHYLGEELFWPSLRLYYQRRDGSVEGLVQAIRETTGQDLTWFFDQWVSKPGHPELNVTAEYDSVARRVTMQVQQVQAPVNNVPEAYQLPVAVRIATPLGDVVTETRLTKRTETIVVDRVLAAPTMIIFDDKDAIYKDLKFEQPTSWLATQLKREPTPWQTWWAITQLAARAPSDTAAVAALIAAVRTARYPLTRDQATEELNASGRAPLATLRDALRDSVPQVRLRAILALGSRSAAEALPLLQKVFETEPMDFLRILGVEVALGLPDSTARAAKVALMERALRTPSADNIIRLRGFAAIAGSTTCYDVLIPVMEDLIGQYLQAVQTVQSLSNKCPAFKALLDRHRTDPRVYVRRWIQRAAKEEP